MVQNSEENTLPLKSSLIPPELLDAKQVYIQFAWEHYVYWSDCFVRWLRLHK